MEIILNRIKKDMKMEKIEELNEFESIELGKYMEVYLKEKKPKTNIYIIINKNNNEPLAHVKWFGSWRQYCLFPLYNPIFNIDCLKEIINFLDQLNKKHNDKNKKNNETTCEYYEITNGIETCNHNIKLHIKKEKETCFYKGNQKKCWKIQKPLLLGKFKGNLKKYKGKIDE